MRDAWELAKELLISPSKAAERLKREDAFVGAAYIYAAFLIASVLFYTLKPVDFPPPDELDLPLDLQSRGFTFWSKVEGWEPFLTIVWLIFLAWFCGYIRTSGLLRAIEERTKRLIEFANARLWTPIAMLFSLPGKLLYFVPLLVMGFLPALPMFLYNRSLISKTWLGLGWIVIGAAMIPILRRREPGSWRPLAAFIMAINVVNLALLPPFIVSILYRSATFYHVLEMGMVFWTLGLGAYVLSRLEKMPTARAFAVIFLSMLGQIWFVFTMHLLGLVSSEILKALMSV